jgi:hypothetical protein
MKENKKNIFSELTNSIKAKLYDFHYSPFISSFVISWIIINHKYLLILFSKEKLELKLEMLNKYQFEIIYGYPTSFIIPVVIALFYVFFYPLIAFIFYKVTLIYQEMMRSEKHKIENKTLITLEEKEILINELSELKNDSNKILEKYVISEKEYQQNIRQRDEQINQLKKQLEEKKILIGEE